MVSLIKKIVFSTSILFIILLMIPFTSSDFITGAWGNYQKQPDNQGFVNDGQSFFETETIFSCSANDGMAFQPLTGDGNFIIWSSSSIKVYQNDCTITLEVSIGTNIASQPSSFNATVVGFVGLNNIAYLWDLATGVQLINFTTNTSCADYTGVVCEDSNCYTVCDFNSVTSDVYRFNETGMKNVSIAVGDINVMGQSPSIAQFTTSAYDSLAFACDPDNNGEFGLCVSRADTLILDVLFSSDGIIDDVNDEGGNSMNEPMIDNVDGGNPELIATYVECDDIGPSNTYSAHLTYYNNDGSVLLDNEKTIRTGVGGVCHDLTGLRAISPPVKHLINEKDSWCFVTIQDSGTRSHNGFTCFDRSGVETAGNITIIDENLQGQYGVDPFAFQMDLISVKLLQSTNALTDRDLIFPLKIIDNTNLSIIELDGDTSDNASTRVIVHDLDSDGSLEIIFTRPDKTTVVSSPFTNSNVQLQNRTFGQNFQSPLCIGTTVTYSANECGSEPCHYTNDGSADTERFRSTCGNSNVTANGTLVLNNPSFSCFYNATGNFQFNMILQDGFHTSNNSQFQLKTIKVINGTSGIDCNLPVSDETLIGKSTISISVTDEFTSEEDIKEATELFTGQSDFIKGLLAITFSFMIIFAILKVSPTAHPLVHAVAISVLWIGLAMIDMLSFVFVFLFGLVMISVTAAFFVKGAGHGGG